MTNLGSGWKMASSLYLPFYDLVEAWFVMLDARNWMLDASALGRDAMDACCWILAARWTVHGRRRTMDGQPISVTYTICHSTLAIRHSTFAIRHSTFAKCHFYLPIFGLLINPLELNGMKALVLREKGEPPFYGDWPDPEPGPNQAVVQLKAAAMNHRDLFITQGLYPGIQYPIILGSDGAGLVGDQEVVINPGSGWGDNPKVQAKQFQVLGLPEDGTFAEKVVQGRDRLHPKPTHLNWVQAAALPLGGLTAYRALFTRGQLQPGERVLIHGVGGGVALIALQFALAIGNQVFVTSGSQQKIDRSQEMGAKGGISYREEGWAKKIGKETGGFDLILESAGGPGFNDLITCIAPGGRIVTYGGTLGQIPKLSPQKVFWKQLSILGSTMGTDQDFKEMLEFVSTHQIVPIVDQIYPLAEGVQGFKRMEAGAQFGKIVFDIA